MKYDIFGLEKDKIIDHYKIVKKKNKRYNIIIYFRKGVGKATNYPYEDMMDLKEVLDSKMLTQLKLLTNNDYIAKETFSNKGSRQAKIFAIIGKSISLLGPLTLSIVFANPINLIFIPILLKITDTYKDEYLVNVIDDQYENYMKYKMCVELEDEFGAIKSNRLDLNQVDNYKIRELKNLKTKLLLERKRKNVDYLLPKQVEKEKNFLKKL